jgi:hypothetical protein
MPKDLIKGQQPFGAGEENTDIKIVVELDRHVSAVPSGRGGCAPTDATTP